MNDRVFKILNQKNISSAKFADEIGVQRSSVSHVISGRNKPSLDFILKIIKRYPEINIEWLLMGKGQMIEDRDIETTKRDLFSKAKDKKEVNKGTKSENSTQNIKYSEEASYNSLSQKQKENGDNRKLRQIDKIVIFYKNKSFREYYPED